MEETTPRVPQKLRADLKTLHRQLEELYARVEAQRTSAGGGPKKNVDPAAFSPGR
jgi:hypothetical protein